MILDSNVLQLDIKVQDSYRELISKLGQEGIELTCVILGDSDIDYELSLDMNNAKILNSPYDVKGVKYPLLYNGSGKGLAGTVTCFARKVDENSKINSLYTYPTDMVYTYGRIPPVLENGFDFDRLDYTDDKMGYILFFQTLLDYYVTDDGIPERLKETYTFNITFNGSSTVPTGWEIVLDEDNGSLLIGKSAVVVSSLSVFDGKIEIEGKTTHNIKIIEFNY